jgi:hypothetical protein
MTESEHFDYAGHKFVIGDRVSIITLEDDDTTFFHQYAAGEIIGFDDSIQCCIIKFDTGNFNHGNNCVWVAKNRSVLRIRSKDMPKVRSWPAT